MGTWNKTIEIKGKYIEIKRNYIDARNAVMQVWHEKYKCGVPNAAMLNVVVYGVGI